MEFLFFCCGSTKLSHGAQCYQKRRGHQNRRGLIKITTNNRKQKTVQFLLMTSKLQSFEMKEEQSRFPVVSGDFDIFGSTGFGFYFWTMYVSFQRKSFPGSILLSHSCPHRKGRKNEKKVTAGLQADTLNVRLFYVKRTTHIGHHARSHETVFSF
jgi:hypothetical protein